MSEIACRLVSSVAKAAFAVSLFLTCMSANAVQVFEVVVKGGGSFRLEVDGKASTNEFSISVPDRGLMKYGIQHDEHWYIDYTTRVSYEKSGRTDKLPEYTPYSNCVAYVTSAASGVGFTTFTYCLLPYFHNGQGCYDHEDVVELMPYWREIFPLFDEREYVFRFVPDVLTGRTLVYLDGSLWGKLSGLLNITGVCALKNGKFIKVVSAGSSDVRVLADHEELPSLPHRAHALLASGASLSVGTGPQVIEGVPMTVWAPERSIDQGRHCQTTTHRNLTWDPLMERTPWNVGTEYLQWRVQGKAWLYAWVLCADIPEPGKSACVGTQYAQFGSGCNSGNIDFERTYLDDTNATIRTVGELRYLKDGQTVTTPLYLVRQPLDIAKLGARGLNQFALDFEFVGCGTSSSYPRSSVQIFGCTLESAAYSYAVNNDVRGNIFEADMPKRAAGFDLTPAADGRRGYYTYEIYDPYFKTLKRGRVDFTLETAGRPQHFEHDLSEWPIGWYGMDFAFYDENGFLITEQSTSFTVLAADDREAGYESPYACWPQLDGKYASNPDRHEQLDVMRKAGYRKSWHPPCESESEGEPWRVTMSSVGLGYYNPGAPTETPEALTRRLDNVVADYRDKFARFPHCKVIQLLHEHGGKEISKEVAGTLVPTQGVYKGWCENWTSIDWDVYFCTEYAKRMRREFPGKRIMIGNGSSSCEMIASLVRNGFDLNLVDQLGIESKGFSSMPELNANLESPGMLWALRETGRVFGYSNLTVNACNEYVFRPERRLSRTASVRSIMRVTDYTLRDYLLSLAHGCDIISTGHLEDCNGAYYDTNWGAAGQCTFYPYSYPKRMYTALAVLTRVLDCPKYLRRLPTGELSTYALEFRRERRVQDYAYALWTPRYGATLAMRFPAGTTITEYDTFGQMTARVPDADGEVRVEVGCSPRYVVASRMATGARVVGHAAPEVTSGSHFVTDLSADAFSFNSKPGGDYSNAYGIPQPKPGVFVARNVTDAELPGHNVVELELQKTGSLPDVIWENTQLDLKTPIPFKLSEVGRLGLYVKGNGAFSMAQLLVKRAKNHTGYPWTLKLGSDDSYVDFDGWQLMSVAVSDTPPKNFDGADDLVLCAIVCGSARKALDPIEMVDVTANLRLGPIVSVPRSADSDPTQEATAHVHNWSDWVDDQPATCTAGGIHSRVCIEPGCSVPPAVEREETDALGHDWGSWAVTVAPQVGVEGRKERTCQRCGEHEAQVVPPLVKPAPTDYGDCDTNTISYAWIGGGYGLWAATSSWQPASLPAYGIPSNATSSASSFGPEVVFPVSLDDAVVDLGGASYTVKWFRFSHTGDLRFVNGTVTSRANASNFRSECGGSVIASGAGAVLSIGNFEFCGAGTMMAAEDGGKVSIGGLRIGFYKPTSDNVFRATGDGSELSVSGTWGVDRLCAKGARFEALDGGTVVYSANRTFEGADDNYYPHDLGTSILASNGTFRVSLANDWQSFHFGSYATDARCYDTRLTVMGRNGQVSVEGKGGAMILGSAAQIASPLIVTVVFPSDGFANVAPIAAAKSATIGANVRIRIDASAVSLPEVGAVSTNRLIYAKSGIAVAEEALARAEVLAPTGAVAHLQIAPDGKSLDVVLEAVPMPTVEGVGPVAANRVFDFARTTKPILCTDEPIVTTNAEGGVDVSLWGVSVPVPSHYSVAKVRVGGLWRLMLTLNESARPKFASGDDTQAIEVGVSKITLNVGNAVPGLFYGIKSATSIEALLLASPTWLPQPAVGTSLSVEIERGDTDTSGFYRIVVDDVLP